MWEKHCIENSHHDIDGGVGLGDEAITLVKAQELGCPSSVELIANLQEDGEDAVEGFQGLGLGRGKAGGEAMRDSVIGVKDLDGVGDGVEGGIVPIVMLGKGGQDLAMWRMFISCFFSVAAI